jgi:putative ABC transport system permease protein
LSLLGALIGTAAAYLALLAWFHRNLQPLTNVPLADLTALVVGLPLIATITSWLLAGRHPTGLARAAIE